MFFLGQIILGISLMYSNLKILRFGNMLHLVR